MNCAQDSTGVVTGMNTSELLYNLYHCFVVWDPLTLMWAWTRTRHLMGKRKMQNLCVMQDVVYSFPVTCKEGKWSIVQGLQIDDFAAQKLKATGDELVEEKALALECLSES